MSIPCRINPLGFSGGLPAGYTPLEHLESTGTQYIDTGFTAADLYHSEITTTIKSDVNRFVTCGVRRAGGFSLYLGFFTNGSAWAIRFSLDNVYSEILEPSIFCELKLGTSYFFVNKKPYPLESPTSFEKVSQYADRFLVFGRTNQGAIEPSVASIKNFSASGKFNLVPSLDPTGAPCMFDAVSRKPFYNQGSGAFIAGIETQKQLDAMLRRLPDRTGQDVGTLQVRLADELQTPENEAKLDAMLAKNWEISQAA